MIDVIAMTDAEFLDHAEAVLKQVELACDRINDSTDVDIDNQRVGGMITLSFAGGSQIVINLQKPLQELWLATRSGGYHYRFDGAVWRDTKSEVSFFERLNQDGSNQSGQSLHFEV